MGIWEKSLFLSAPESALLYEILTSCRKHSPRPILLKRRMGRRILRGFRIDSEQFSWLAQILANLQSDKDTVFEYDGDLTFSGHDASVEIDGMFEVKFSHTEVILLSDILRSFIDQNHSFGKNRLNLRRRKITRLEYASLKSMAKRLIRA